MELTRYPNSASEKMRLQSMQQLPLDTVHGGHTGISTSTDSIRTSPGVEQIPRP